MTTKEYEDGKLASRFLNNGTGFIYYPNGLVAVCISEVTEYQNRYFAFDKDRKNTLLLSFDEHSVGFISGSKRKQLKGNTPECTFTKIGGLITNSEGRIINQWKWDLKAQNSGNPPSEPVIFRLNEHLVCIFKNRFEVSLTFEYDSIKYEFEIGMKFKRNDTYLDNVKKTLDGRLIPQIQHTSLRERQIEFGKEMQNQRNKLHPRSENLSNMVQGIVGNLEQNFDSFGETLKLPPVELSTIKHEAFQKTLNEIPRIESTGMETGIYAGFSKDIYVNKGEKVNLAKTAPAKLFSENGQWKDSLAIRTTLREENPPLSRKSAILKASGRYSDMLVVDPQSVSSDNPTGMIEIRGLPLQHVRWENLKKSLANENPKLLTVVLVLRAGDPICCSYLRVAELVNLKYQKNKSEINNNNNNNNNNTQTINTNNTNNTNHTNSSRPPSALNSSSYHLSSRPPKIYQIDVSESSNVIKELGIKSLPIFLIFQGSNLVYAGSIGGRNVKLDTTVHKPQVMLIESNFRDQITCEKTLRKLGCEPYLCLTVNEAVNRIQQFSNPLPNPNGHTPDPIIFDLILISEDVPADNLMNLRRVLKDITQDSNNNNRNNNNNNNNNSNNNGSGRTIIAMLINVLGEFGRSNLNAVHWESGCTNDVTAFSRRDLASVCSMAIQKPIKQIAIEKLLSMRQISHTDSNFGLTPETLERKISQIFQESLNGQCRRIDYVGIRMSAQDTKLRNGKELIS